jgi:hypothetical protein
MKPTTAGTLARVGLVTGLLLGAPWSAEPTGPVPLAGRHEPLVTRRQIMLAPSESSGAATILVPLDRWLVIETVAVSGFINSTAPANPFGKLVVDLLEPSGTGRVEIEIPVTSVLASTQIQFRGLDSVRIYAAPGSKVDLMFVRLGSAAGNAIGDIAISGYLTSTP